MTKEFGSRDQDNKTGQQKPLGQNQGQRGVPGQGTTGKPFQGQVPGQGTSKDASRKS